MITIIDYGMGNLGSIANMLKKIGAESRITSDAKLIDSAQKLILPGVGSYAMAMDNLHQLGLVSILQRKATEGVPLLGICLGMQLLSSHSEEGNAVGLNIIPGYVKKFALGPNVKVPHMGWNLIKYNKESLMFKGFEDLDEVRFYFVHSYFYQCSDSMHSVATCNYETDFTCAVQHQNTMGVQFHPEKSHKFGMKLLTNFCAI